MRGERKIPRQPRQRRRGRPPRKSEDSQYQKNTEGGSKKQEDIIAQSYETLSQEQQEEKLQELLNKGYCRSISENPNAFTKLSHTYIADKMLEHGKGIVFFIKHLNNLKELDHNDVVDRILSDDYNPNGVHNEGNHYNDEDDYDDDEGDYDYDDENDENTRLLG